MHILILRILIVINACRGVAVVVDGLAEAAGVMYQLFILRRRQLFVHLHQVELVQQIYVA